jgi:hypothetical protein
MDVDVGLRCSGMRLENEKFLDLTYCKKRRSMPVWLGRTFALCNRDKRATPTIGEGSLKMAPFEMLYGCRCRTPLFWNEIGEREVFGPDILQEAEKHARMVRENLRVVQSRQKSYANHRRRELSFEVRDFVYLKVSPMRGLHRFKIRGKLGPRFIRPFKILEKRGEVAYQLELPP